MMRPHLSGCPKTLLLGGFLLVLAASTPLVAGVVVVGAPADAGAGNCIPFGCNYASVGDGQYQQVYTSTLFSGPITITGLEFYNTQFDNRATAMNRGLFTISLSTTSADWNTLSANAASNIGGDNAQVFSDTLAQPWAFGDTLSIVFSTPFTYTPGANANLLLNVIATGTASSGSIFFDTNGDDGNSTFNGNTFFGRYYNVGSNNVDHGYGLVTGFDNGLTETPEPATLALLGAGLAGLSLLRKRVLRRSPHSTQFPLSRYTVVSGL